jgi:hypothetical protein
MGLKDGDGHVRDWSTVAMARPLSSIRFHFPFLTQSNWGRGKSAIAGLVLLVPVACATAAAQGATNTTISGAVYDPRTANALPLSNVLVYATTAPVAPLPTGVQCLTYQAPTGVVSYAYTAVDGTFTLGNIPENAIYTVVIQAGKWRRQFTETVAGGPLTGLTLNMPADHTQGDIPMIAIVTGSVDGAECVLHDMGIASTEFTDDNGTVNPGGHIHLYKGGGSPGADISATTPVESTLTGSSANLSNYDMVMFPCQGSPTYIQGNIPLNNILNYANAGGRIFTTHYSYVYLDPNAPSDAQFPPVANWTTTPETSVNAGVGTVNTNFSDGATLAQWLQNSGATVTGTANQIDISTLRTDVGTVIPPTQSWLTLNSGSYAGQTTNPVMQMTFNTPVGAAAANQCGRVMYNDYHVITPTGGSATSKIFPAECPAETSMSAQEEMLEYALFDLSTFVQPVVVPTLSIGFNPNPMVVKQNDVGDQVTVNVTNTSTTTAIASSAILNVVLGQYMTATAISDPTGGWNCTLATLTCTRNASLAASAADSVTVTVSVGTYPAGFTSGTLSATVSSVTFSSNVSASENVIYQQPPTIVWPTPAPIVYGTALSGAQLDATASVPGTFVYSPAAGAMLTVGQQLLQVTFTPTDTVHYSTATASVMLTVLPVTPNVTLTTSANPVLMTYGVSFTASLPSNAGTQTGTMTFYDGSVSIGSANLAGGAATFTTTALTMGPHSITAVYSGDANYGPGTSNAVAETVEDFTLAFASGGTGKTSVPAGGLAVYTLLVTPVGGATLPAAVNLGATDVPVGMTATFTPATIAAGSGSTNVTLQVTLPAQGANEVPRWPFGNGKLPVALGLILLPFAGRLRKGSAHLARLMVLVVAGALLAIGLTGCGANLSSQSFSFTVTAASGSLSHSVAPQLTVQ